jgi:hypothetical protein
MSPRPAIILDMSVINRLAVDRKVGGPLMAALNAGYAVRLPPHWARATGQSLHTLMADDWPCPFPPETRRQLSLDSILRHLDVSRLDPHPDGVPAAAGGSQEGRQRAGVPAKTQDQEPRPYP